MTILFLSSFNECYLLGGWVDGTMAWIGGASGDINDHDGHEFLCDDHDLDLNDYDDHDGGGAGAA